MRDSSTCQWLMEKEDTLTLKDPLIRELGNLISKKDKEKNLGEMDHLMKDNIKTD